MGDNYERLQRLAAGLAVCLLLAACATLTTLRLTGNKGGSGIRFSHTQHAEVLECGDCHMIENRHASIPDHDICGICHEIDNDDPETCQLCHTHPEYEVAQRRPILSPELVFSHETHDEQDIGCMACHPAPDRSVLPRGPVKPFCMNCHEQADPALNACPVCHTQIRRDTVPTTRQGKRLPHDAPQIWEMVHGKEFRFDPNYCSLCHDNQSFCQDCHTKNPPRDHTIAWRRKPHGLRASWDRDRCMACHEQDSCMKCHLETQPASHRGAWGRPVNRHCANCHYPPQEANCTVCHLRIDHRTAKPSPHNFAVYPRPCSACHPGGNPFLAPHPQNSTITCRQCH